MDDDIKAMTTISDALSDLDDEARARVLTWAVQKFASTTAVAAGLRTPGTPGDAERTNDEGFAHFADLYDRVSPTTNSDRLLAGAYWKQVVEGTESFTAQQVNDMLKDVGHGVSSIAKVFTSLQERTPALVRQLSKSGRTQQARKTYKLTTAGVSEVRGRL